MQQKKEEQTMNKEQPVQGKEQQKAGLNCPGCGSFIETNIFQLLTTTALVCKECHLKLNIDRMKSRSALEALRKIQAAKEEVERKSTFG